MRKLYPSIFTLFLSFLTLPLTGLACDGSGYVINGLIDNGDGTYTIDMTIHIAGSDYSGGILGGTQGFYFTSATPIISVTPPSLTSLNGTTFNASISGNTVTWGTPGSGPYFVASNEPTQTFPVMVVVNGFPPNWNGGGMEENGCPGGPGTSNPSPGYSGTFCLPPSISISPGAIDVCAGEQVTLTAMASNGAAINWSNGASGPSTTFTANNTMAVTATAANGCGADSETITVNVTPLPTLSPLSDVNICEGESVTLNALAQNTDLIEWSNGFVGTPIVFTPSSSEVLTVTASSQCGMDLQVVNINVTPLPTLAVIQGDQSICEGEVATLEVQVENADNLSWNNAPPLTQIFVTPSQTQVYTVTASNECLTLQENILVEVSPMPSIAINQGDQSICLGESVTLDVFPMNIDEVFWSNGVSGPTNTFSPTQTDTYTVSGSNSCGYVEEAITVEVAYPSTTSSAGGYATSTDMSKRRSPWRLHTLRHWK